MVELYKHIVKANELIFAKFVVLKIYDIMILVKISDEETII